MNERREGAALPILTVLTVVTILWYAGAILLNLGVYGLMSGNAALAPVAVAGSLVTIAGMLIFAFIVYTKV